MKRLHLDSVDVFCQQLAPRLKRLDLENVVISLDQFDLSMASSLEHLSIGIYSRWDNIILIQRLNDCLPSMTKLTGLELNFPSTGDFHLPALTHLRSLTRLSLRNYDCIRVTRETIDAVASCSKLEYLYLTFSHGEGLRMHDIIERCQSLIEVWLDIPRNSIDQHCMALLGSLPSLRALRVDAVLKASINEILSNSRSYFPALIHLDLLQAVNSPIPTSYARFIMQPNAPKLVSLNVKLGGQGDEAFIQPLWSKLPQLRQLELSTARRAFPAGILHVQREIEDLEIEVSWGCYALIFLLDICTPDLTLRTNLNLASHAVRSRNARTIYQPSRASQSPVLSDFCRQSKSFPLDQGVSPAPRM